MKNNKNKIITLGMAGAVALSAPLSFVYATDDIIIVDSCDEDHIEYPFVDLDNDGFCDNCGTEKKENTENTETSTETESTETTETGSTETTEEKEDISFHHIFKISKYGYEDDLDYIVSKLEKNGKYEDYFYLSDRNLQVKVDIYDKDNNLINSLVILDGREIGVDVLDSYKYQISLVGDNVKEVEGYGKVICDYIKGIPILKQYTLGFCQRTHKDIEIVEERIIKVDWENPDFDLKEFFENNEEIARSFFPHKFQGSGTVLGKDNCLMSMPLPIIPDLPETSETTETTESTETPSTEEPSTETPSTEKPSTETPSTEEPSTETPSTEKPSTETPSTEEPSTETPSTEEPSTETPSTEEPSTETPSTETPSTEEPSTETPSTEEPSTETPSTEEPSTETPSTEEPSTETPSTEEPSTETPSIEEPSTETPTPTPEPVKPVEPTPTTETTTITEDRGKVDPSEKNEMVQTGDLATNTYYGGYFLVTAFGVLTAFFKKFKK